VDERIEKRSTGMKPNSTPLSCRWLGLAATSGLTVAFLAFLPTFLGCHLNAADISTADHSKSPAERHGELQIAIKHYEAADIPEGEVLKMFEQLAQNGDVRATMWIARFHQLGRCSLPKRADIAQKMARDVIGEVTKLAENGDTEAQFVLGSAYQLGIAVDQDLEKAVKWYTKSVDGGHITAMNNLAVMFARGHGTEPDIDNARLLFSRAAKLGSQGAAKNLSAYGDDNRDDSKRLHSLRTVALVQALGMQKEQAIAFLAKNGLISDPKALNERDYNDRKQYHFRADGIVLDVDVNGRITNVEGHAKGSRESDQFRGEIPLGVTWNTTLKSALQALGTPDHRGYLRSDGAYGLVYRMENVSFVVMFSYEGEYKLKVWRVYENWAIK
jgi:hypothetical protein